MFMIKWHKLPVGLLNSMRADLMESLAWGTAGAADQVRLHRQCALPAANKAEGQSITWRVFGGLLEEGQS